MKVVKQERVKFTTTTNQRWPCRNSDVKEVCYFEAPTKWSKMVIEWGLGCLKYLAMLSSRLCWRLLFFPLKLLFCFLIMSSSFLRLVFVERVSSKRSSSTLQEVVDILIFQFIVIGGVSEVVMTNLSVSWTYLMICGDGGDWWWRVDMIGQTSSSMLVIRIY